MLAAACWAEGAFGTWKMNPARSTSLEDPQPKSFIVRIETHGKGEVFTLETIPGAGRALTSSTILYLDGKSREYEDTKCSGTQSSRRVDERTVEITRICRSGESTRFVRRLAARPKELILEITEQQPGSRQVERRLVLEKQ